jgi:hypothetical protein
MINSLPRVGLIPNASMENRNLTLGMLLEFYVYHVWQLAVVDLTLQWDAKWKVDPNNTKKLSPEHEKQNEQRVETIVFFLIKMISIEFKRSEPTTVCLFHPFSILCLFSLFIAPVSVLMCSICVTRPRNCCELPWRSGLTYLSALSALRRCRNHRKNNSSHHNNSVLPSSHLFFSLFIFYFIFIIFFILFIYFLFLTVSASKARGLGVDFAQNTIAGVRLPSQDVCATECKQDSQGDAPCTHWLARYHRCMLLLLMLDWTGMIGFFL